MISEGVMAAENSALSHKNKLHFKIYKIENSYFKLYEFHNITVLF